MIFQLQLNIGGAVVTSILVPVQRSQDMIVHNNSEVDIFWCDLQRMTKIEMVSPHSKLKLFFVIDIKHAMSMQFTLFTFAGAIFCTASIYYNYN